MIAGVINKLEKVKIPFLTSIAFVFSIIFIREMIECFSDIGNPWIALPFEQFLFHYPFFFIISFLFMVIAAQLFTRQRIQIISKVFLIFFPLLWLGPIIDLFFGGGNTRYVQFTTISGYFSALLNYFYVPKEGGVTLGILIETTIMFIILFIYVFHHTKSVWRSSLATLFSYILIKTLGSLPSLVNIFLSNFNGISKLTISSIHLGRTYDSVIKISTVLYLILVICLAVYFYLYNKKKFHEFFGYLSVTRIINYLLLFNAGAIVAINQNGTALSCYEYILIFMANLQVVFLWILAKGMNDYHDIMEDRISNKRNPFISKVFLVEETLSILAIILILLLFGSYIINYEFFFVVIIIISISYIYSSPPLRFKKYFFLSHGSIAFCSGLTFLLGLLLINKYPSLPSTEKQLFLGWMIMFFLGSHIKDIKDYEGDKKGKVYTLPTVFGLKTGKIIISLLLAISYFYAALLFTDQILILLAVLFSIISFYLINKKEYDEELVFFTYFLFILVLIHSFMN